MKYIQPIIITILTTFLAIVYWNYYELKKQNKEINKATMDCLKMARDFQQTTDSARAAITRYQEILKELEKLKKENKLLRDQ